MKLPLGKGPVSGSRKDVFYIQKRVFVISLLHRRDSVPLGSHGLPEGSTHTQGSGVDLGWPLVRRCGVKAACPHCCLTKIRLE